jgi:hypothetical protein
MANQSHGTSIWQEPAGSGGAPGVVAVYLVDDGTGDLVWSPVGPADAAPIGWEGNGDYEILWLTPATIIASGGDLLITTTPGGSPAAAIVADATAGDLEVTTDLTRAVAADVFVDGAGNPVVARRSAPRGAGVQMSDGSIMVY